MYSVKIAEYIGDESIKFFGVCECEWERFYECGSDIEMTEVEEVDSFEGRY